MLVVSNRLPVSLSFAAGKPVLETSAGGLATALGDLRGLSGWLGWPGAEVADELKPKVERLLAKQALHPVFLCDEEIAAFYGRICNETLWPLFHYFVGRVQFDETAWSVYEAVNERFAAAIARRAPQGGRVWIHDFHLMLVPEALRRLRPDLSIGFFLHTPFPSSEAYRTLPAREQVLRGLLGADYLGFQTGDYARHFRSACLRVLGIETRPDAIEHDGRLVGVNANPIGVDVQSFRDALRDDETEQAYAELEQRYDGMRLVLGIERLDYTKGIPHKLRAFERFLELDPERATDTTMLQVVVPSRLDSAEYVAQRDEIELLIAQINGRFGQPGRTPVEYIHRGLGRAELLALYRRADVMAVTPLRDGMNLVAHEFALVQAAARGPGRRAHGALVLSELAGAAQFLPGALLVNPWDVAGIAQRIGEGLALHERERDRRIRLLAQGAERLDCHRWAEAFLSRLDRYSRARRKVELPPPLDGTARTAITERFRRSRLRTLLLDYDGTLQELASHPDLAAPSTDLYARLDRLARLPATEVHVISGRKVQDLDRWFGDRPVYLSAEHGFWSKTPGGEWRQRFELDLAWLPRVERFLRRAAVDVPGSLVEKKTCSVAWHYRQAEREYGDWRARELLVQLENLIRGEPADILLGHYVIEIRAQGVDKGTYVHELFAGGRRRSQFVLAAGDDETDFDLYQALPHGSISVHVGIPTPRPHRRRGSVTYSAASPAEIRLLLREIAEAAERGLSIEGPGAVPA